MPLPQTPTRRSQRFQPTATPIQQIDSLSILECVWDSKPIFIRPMNPQIDLLPEEQEEWEGRGSDDDNDIEEDGDKKKNDELETVFYEAFKMKRRPQTYRGKKSKTPVQHVTYRVGDTVLVETDKLYLQTKPPSIGVIVALWETRRIDVGSSDSDPNKMRIRIHWFLRPSEMAAIRAKREHKENEIYYCLSTRVIVTPGVILSRCKVSSVSLDSIVVQPKSKAEASAPSKRKGGKGSKSPLKSPSKSPSKFWDVVGDEEASDSDEAVSPSKLFGSSKDATDISDVFLCRFAVDSRRGLFFDFKWDSHHKACLLRSRPPALSDEQPPIPGPSSSKDDNGQTWGEGGIWDVELEKPGKRGGKRGRKQGNSAVAGGNDDHTHGSGDEVSESEVDDSDEFEGDDSDVSDAGHSGAEEEEEEEGVDDHQEDENDLMEPRTPSKKRKRPRNGTATPRKGSKRSKTLAHPTPHSKAALARRKRRADGTSSPSKRKVGSKFAIRFPEQSLAFKSTMAHLPKDPWIRAMHALHVGSRPDTLPCREEEYAKVLRCVGELLEEGSGGCVYISGVPGTGKTATVHAIVRELKRMAESSEINPFNYVEINGLKIPEPSAAYNLLWEGISGHDVVKEGHLKTSAKESLKALMRYFTSGNRGPGGHACVVLMDELDQLVTPKQDVVYNFFNWPTLVGSKLVVIAVANTMDLPERVMTGRVRSRLGMIRINFQPYTREQLEKIVEARLASSKEGMEDENEGKSKQVVIAPDAIKLAAMMVSRITGDARRVLDICRRAVELVQSAHNTVKAPHIREVVQVMQNSPTAAFLKDLSFHERLMLASLVKCIKREGVEEIKWSEVQHQHLIYLNVLAGEDDPSRKPTPSEMLMVLDSLVSSRAVVIEEGAVVARKGDGERRMVLNIEQGEVERVLSDVGGQRWKNVLSTSS